jgi:tetratricopeptide (TPR) repeat protein
VRWAHGNLPGAIAALSDSATPDTRLQAYERAGFHAEAGEWAAARDDFKRARDLDFCLPNQPPGACAFRASSAENAAIADEVRKSGGIVVDADAVFAEQLPHGIVEWETMWDYCHPNGEPLDFLARRILTLGAPAAASCVAHAPAPSEGTAFSADSLYRRLAAPVETLFDGNPRKLGWEVFADNSGWRHRVDGIITLLQRRFPDQAMTLVAQYDRDAASTYDPASHAAALDAIADAARDEGRLDIARWCLERSVAVSPAVPALVDLSLVHLRLQDETAARADLEQALKLEPDSAQAANVREAMLGETSAPPHAGEDVPVRATPPG